MPLRPPFPEPIELTRREREVAGYLGEDLGYADLAARMGVTTETVRLHAKNVFRKLGVSSRHAAVDELWRRGALTVPGAPACPTRAGNGDMPGEAATTELKAETGSGRRHSLTS